MKTLLFLFLTLFSGSALAELEMKFYYEVNDSGDRLSCTHTRIRDYLPDWKVVCGEGQKNYTAHVVLRKYERSSPDETAFELLYWVTEPGDTATSVRKYHSISAMLHFNGKSEIQKWTLSEGIENSQASLRLELKASSL